MKDYLGWFSAGLFAGLALYMWELFQRHECPECTMSHDHNTYWTTTPWTQASGNAYMVGGDPWLS